MALLNAIAEVFDYLDGKIKLSSNKYDLSAKNDADLKSKIINKEDKSNSEIHNFIESEIDLATDELKEISDIDLGKVNLRKHTQLTNNFNNKDSAFTNDDDVEGISISDLDIHSADILSSTANNEYNIWNTCENWRGKAELKNIVDLNKSPINKSSVKKRAKPSYLDKCPEWEFIKNAKVAKQPTFKNGLFCNPIILEKFRINVRNTCAFDSIFQIIMSAIASNQIYRKSINKSVALASSRKRIIDLSIGLKG
ncbi:hypothetical protein PUN28_016893 [Cardiocondyla obscurior]|uniref:Uncharacterized protein n=1 Tax=Cardiocondyla obscurior TaxID=286306 RepID=A0AAW2ESX4_9HYME